MRPLNEGDAVNLYNQLPHTTSRIVAARADGSTSVGTGFFFNTPVKGGQMTLLFTNKHVLKNASSARVFFSRAGSDGNAQFGQFNSWNVEDIGNVTVGHPDDDVDLMAFPVGGILNEMTKEGTPAFFRAFDATQIPSDDVISELTAIEDVLMIGYPTGLWDQANNLPIIRRGITATPYARDYDGKAEFMIDCACFPGSSGSPVMIANQGSYATDGALVLGTRLLLLGLLWGGPQYSAQGEIVAKPVPTAVVPVAVSKIPTNLGYCVKSRRILELIPMILKTFGAEAA